MRQQKKRRYNDRDEDEREKTPEPVEDPLRNATTLYVGNLYVTLSCVQSECSISSTTNMRIQVLLHNRRADPRAIRKGRRDQETRHGTGQIQQDAMWLLLR